MDGKPARSASLTDFENEAIKHLCLLTMKPVIYVANVAETELAEPASNPYVKEVMNLASELKSGLVTISAQVSITQVMRARLRMMSKLVIVCFCLCDCLPPQPRT